MRFNIGLHANVNFQFANKLCQSFQDIRLFTRFKIPLYNKRAVWLSWQLVRVVKEKDLNNSRYLLGSARVGSSPAVVVFLQPFVYFEMLIIREPND